MKKDLSKVVAAAAAASMALSCGSFSAMASDSKGSLVVGGVFNTSGQLAAYDQVAEQGFSLAIDEINANGGAGGYQLDYKMINAQSDAAQNTSAAQKLIDVEGAVVLAGCCETDTCTAAATVAQDAGVPFITVGATLPDLPARVGDYFYMAPYGDNVQAAAIATYAYEELGARTAYVVWDTTSEYTVALAKYFQETFESLGGEVVLTDTYDDNGYTDFSSEIAKVQALGEAPDVMCFSSFSTEGPLMLKQFRAAGIDAPVVSGDGFDDISIPQIAGSACTNVYYSTHVNYDTDSELVQNFVKKYTDTYGTAPENAFAALGYDTAYLIKTAIESIDGDVTSEAIRDAISQIQGFEGVTGTISYENGSQIPTKSVTINEFVDGEIKFMQQVGGESAASETEAETEAE